MTCAIYCRLSKEDAQSQGESESIQNQRNLLTRYAGEQGWDICGIYCDDDYSGADRDRPEWNNMLRAARSGTVDIILCKNQSRFTRDLEMVEKYIHGLFPLWGVRFVALLDQVDTGVAGNKKARQINGLINEWYLEDLSENVRAVLDQRRRSGKFIGSFAVYGYQKDPADHSHLIVDEEAAQTVRLIFRLFLQGMGTHKIACYLNDRGVLNPSKYKQSKGLGYVNGCERRPEGCWHPTTVSRILRNEAYIGTLVQGMKRKASYKSKKLLSLPPDQWVRVEHAHEPIIDREIFEAAGRRLRSRTRSDGTGEAHVLSGKLRCADCGKPMIKIANGYKGTPRHYLQCSTYAANRKNPPCAGHTIRLDYLMDAVGERIRRHIQQFYAPGDLGRFQSEDRAKRCVEDIRREIRSANQQMDKISATVRGLYMDKVAGILTKEQFQELNGGYLAESAGLRQQVQILEKRLEELGQSSADSAKPPEARVNKLLELNHIGRELYDMLIDRIEIGEKDAAAKIQAVHIKWRF